MSRKAFTLAEILITLNVMLQNHKGEKSMVKERTASKGFTLAEILITLTVIGVVAALTIPTLLQNTNQAELKTALKRDFADLSQATLSIKNDKGGSLVNAFPGDALGTESLKNAFKAKLSYLKECYGTSAWGGGGNGTAVEGCWHASGAMQYLSGVKINGWDARPGLILNNGTFIFFRNIKSDCSATSGDFKSCAYSTFDVNGFKKPNTVGKDIFRVQITDDGMLPDGTRGLYDPDNDTVYGCLPTAEGWGCTAKYLYQ